MEFYQSKKWMMVRQRILRRDAYLCQRCKRYGRMREATIVHHIEHLDERPDLAFEPTNLMSVCKACHEKLHPEKGQIKTQRTGGQKWKYQK